MGFLTTIISTKVVELSGQVRSTPIFLAPTRRTVKVWFTSRPRIEIIIPSKVWIRVLDPSITLELTRTVSPTCNDLVLNSVEIIPWNNTTNLDLKSSSGTRTDRSSAKEFFDTFDKFGIFADPETQINLPDSIPRRNQDGDRRRARILTKSQVDSPK